MPRDDEGAAAVEFALLFPIFIIVVIGMISAGTAFSKYINLVQSARETSRFGATLTFSAAGGDVDDWLTKVSDAGQTAAGPDDDPLGGHDSICVAFIDVAVAANSRYKIDDQASVQPSSGQGCPGTNVNTDLGPRYVQVVVERETSYFAVFLDKDLTLRSMSTTPYEPSGAP